MFSLYPDQRDILQALSDAYQAGARRLLLQAPTGAGKTVLFTYVAAQHLKHPANLVYVLAHRAELIEQIRGALERWGITPGIIAPNHRYDETCRIQIASVFSLIRRISRIPHPTMVIVDEAHHAAETTTWGKILACYPFARVLGVTATPCRMTGAGLSKTFDRLISGPSTAYLQSIGRLAPLITYAPSAIAVDGLKRARGDWEHKALAERADTSKVTGDAVQHYLKLAPAKSFVGFCVSVAHANHVAEAFRDCGVTAEAIDGSLDHDDRRAMVRRFRDRTTLGLLSCDLISEGFDVPGIEAGISLRPTLSRGLWLQQAGRILRVHPGKDRAILLDHAGNTLSHGLVTDDQQWSLEDGAVDHKRRPGVGVRICPACFAANRSTAKECVLCGAAFPIEAREVGEREGELTEITEAQAAAIRQGVKNEQWSARSFDALVALGRQRGYRNPYAWARHIMNARAARGTL